MTLTVSKIATVAMVLMMGRGGGTSAPETVFTDSDGDGVQDADDLCPGSDDTVDLDGNDIADCSETLAPEFMFDSPADVAGATLGSHTLASFSPSDGGGYSGSGSMRLVSNAGSVTSAAFVCVNIMPWEDEVEMWFNVTTGWSPGSQVRTGYRYFNGSDCSGSISLFSWGSSVGTTGASSGAPWPTFSDQRALPNGTRSVQIGITVPTTQPDGDPWYLDNLLVRGVTESESWEGPPGMQ
ncbi:MAG: hypothetical protein AAF799_04215 [Myxococcota bacterium]